MIELRAPIFASILNNRVICIAVSVAAIVQLSLVSAGLPGWSSPFHTVLGIPDLGCGLSRASVALLRGDWQRAFTYHAFAPAFVVALGMIGLAAFLPHQMRRKIAAWVEFAERRTGLTAFLLIGLVVYWLARLLFMREAFLALIAN